MFGPPNCLERKLDGAAKKVGRQCAHLICLPPFLPPDFKEKAGRQACRQRAQGFHNHVRHPSLSREPRPPAHALKALGTATELLVGPVTEVETERQASADAQRSLACSSIAQQVFFFAPVYVRKPRCLIASRKEKNKGKRKNWKRQDLAGARSAMLPFASVVDAQESLGRNLTYLELQWFRHTSGVSDYILYCYNIVFLFIIFNLAPLPLVLLDVLQVRAAEKYKLQPGVHNSRDAVWKCYKSVMLLFFTVVGPLQLSSFPAVRFIGVRMGFPLPSFAEVVLHLFVYVVVEDYLNYWIHRWLHQGWLYENIHRVHHEFMSPMSFAAPYAHWAEIILLGVPTFMGPAMVPGHIITLWIWIALRQLEAIDTHSGYDFPWNPTKLIPFYGGAEYHDYHHFVGGKSQSNFASVFTYCDWLYGTDKGYRYLKENHRKEMIAKAKLNSLDMGWMEIDSLKPLPNHHWKQTKLS